MATYSGSTDRELPDLRTIVLPKTQVGDPEPRFLRRSPRKTASVRKQQDSTNLINLTATSNQRLLSPSKKVPAKRSSLKTLPDRGAVPTLLQDVPVLPRKHFHTLDIKASASNRQAFKRGQGSPRLTEEEDSLLVSFSSLSVTRNPSSTKTPGVKGSETTRAGRKQHSSIAERKTGSVRGPKVSQRASKFVLSEARCDEDLADSDDPDGTEDEDTDLSGFIVEDGAEISYDESSLDEDSEEERRARLKTMKQQPRRRLQRGRKKIVESEDEISNDGGLPVAPGRLQLGGGGHEHTNTKDIEVIDLISPEPKPEIILPNHDIFISGNINLFDKLKALKLSPPRSSQPSSLPSKTQSTMSSSSVDHIDRNESTRPEFATPPTTPPRSPSKLKSPSKLLSPSKRDEVAPRSPHRPSMDAFWDLNEVNEWNDQISPKKEPIASPRKNRLALFDDWSDIEEDSLEALNETSDSLPSPCESPSKSKSRSVSPVKAEKQRFLAEKRAKRLEKQLFDATKEQMAKSLFSALDKNVTSSQISTLSATTGGVQIIWSNTLRSTAGRANWRRTMTKPTGSPVKSRSDESAPGTTIQHFANIELATKVIDRQDRLTNTLAHEFCHLANFMISGIRDQPHGASFQNWARKVTTWMKSQTDVPEWNTVEVTTKHGYVIEWKYLWLCTGRESTQAAEILNIDDDNGCGAEYGRHSKSINTDTQRCGRCKGRLVQVRPKPRASPAKKIAGRKMPVRGRKGAESGSNGLEKMIEVVELSD